MTLSIWTEYSCDNDSLLRGTRYHCDGHMIGFGSPRMTSQLLIRHHSVSRNYCGSAINEAPMEN